MQAAIGSVAAPHWSRLRCVRPAAAPGADRAVMHIDRTTRQHNDPRHTMRMRIRATSRSPAACHSWWLMLRGH